jgi:tetratricopeptide (TPR) repeat protein
MAVYLVVSGYRTMHLKTLTKCIFILFLFTSCKQTNEQLIAKGTKLYNKEKYKEAIEIYTKVLISNNRLQSAYYNRGLCFIKLENYFKALGDFDTVMIL